MDEAQVICGGCSKKLDPRYAKTHEVCVKCEPAYQLGRVRGFEGGADYTIKDIIAWAEPIIAEARGEELEDHATGADNLLDGIKAGEHVGASTKKTVERGPSVVELKAVINDLADQLNRHCLLGLNTTSKVGYKMSMSDLHDFVEGALKVGAS